MNPARSRGLGGPSASATIALGLGCWLGLFLFYWWLVSKLEPQQMVAAALAGLATALGLLALRRAAALRFRIRARWLGLLLLRLPGKVLRDLCLLAAELWRAMLAGRHSRGALKPLAFEPGHDDPQSAARRALVVMGVSLPPNSVAIAIQRKRKRLLVHQLVSRAEAVPDPEWPL